VAYWASEQRSPRPQYVVPGPDGTWRLSTPGRGPSPPARTRAARQAPPPRPAQALTTGGAARPRTGPQEAREEGPAQAAKKANP